MSITIETSDLVKQLLEKCRIQPKMLDQYRESLAAVAGQYQWHGQNDIQTLKGLPGTYMWTENLPLMQQITFQFVPAASVSEGSYTLMQGATMVEQGQFHCSPNNPAIGWASILLEPTQGTMRICFILGMLTDANWKIMNMTLLHSNDSGPAYPLFSAMRIGA